MPLHYVDPNKKRGRVYTVNARFGAAVRDNLLPAIYHLASTVVVPQNPRALPASLGVVVTAPLMTTGAKSGQPREVQLA